MTYIPDREWRVQRWLKAKGVSQFVLFVKTQRAIAGWVKAAWSRWRRPLTLAAIAAVIVGTLGVGIVVAYRMWHVPPWVLEGAVTKENLVSRTMAYRAAQAGILGVLIQITAGMAIFAGLFFTWRQVIAGQEAHISERFTRSVEQLANDRVEIRVGGVQGLERIAVERDTEFLPILRLLTAFALERVRAWQQARSLPKTNAALPLDLQMALAALFRFAQRLTRFREQVEFQGIDLSYTFLRDAKFAGFDLSGANFENSDLKGASFAGALLNRANCAKCELTEALFAGAELQDANLSGANLVWADFQGARLFSVNAAGANLTDAILRHAMDRSTSETQTLRGPISNGVCSHTQTFAEPICRTRFSTVQTSDSRASMGRICA